MILRSSVLCPIDFSEGSRGALRYAGVIASHLGARLTVLAVDDPLLIEAAEFADAPVTVPEDTVQEMRKFCAATLAGQQLTGSDIELEVGAGKPAAEILRIARTGRCDLIVMGSHGATGFRKLFFGSTTERVLRETPVPCPGDPSRGQRPGATCGCAAHRPANPGSSRSDRRHTASTGHDRDGCRGVERSAALVARR